MPFFVDISYSSKLEGISLRALFRVQKEVCFEEEVHVTFRFTGFCLKSGLCHCFTLFKAQLQKIERFPSVLLVYEKQYEVV